MSQRLDTVGRVAHDTSDSSLLCDFCESPASRNRGKVLFCDRHVGWWKLMVDLFGDDYHRERSS